MQLRIDQPMRYRYNLRLINLSDIELTFVQPKIDQPKRYRYSLRLITLCDSELTFDKPTIDQPMRYPLQPAIDQPMRYRKQFNSTYGNYYLCDIELHLIQPMVIITYGCIQKMECNLWLSEVLGYPTREMSTPTREMFVNPHEGIVQGYEGNVRLRRCATNQSYRTEGPLSEAEYDGLDTHEGIW